MVRALRPSKGNEVLMAANQPEKLAKVMLLPLLLLLLFYGVSNARCSTIPDNSTDMLALLDFKQAVTDPRGALNTWNSSIPHCQWEGVNCSRKHLGRVTVLSLGGLGLAGPISPSIGNLTFLENLNLSLNSLSGELPPLNRFHKLQQLVMANNSLQGIIPDTLVNCSNLKWLDLSGNSLTGEIPLGIHRLSYLVFFQISANNLSGIIPPSVKNMTNLRVLSFANNQLTGSIPDELGISENLTAVDLGGNSLSGGIPGNLFNCSLLELLDLSLNMLGKELPPDITLPSLLRLYLDYNNFEGHIPTLIGNSSGLIELDLSSNSFTGKVPSSLGNLGVLNYLNLQNNKLEANDRQSWEFVDRLSNFSSLGLLALTNNHFEGAIPNSIGKLSNILQVLLLGMNNLSGIIPTSFANLTGLTTLDLSYNNLSGSIERWVGNMKLLVAIALDGNNFTGPIPSSMGNFTKLTVLSLAKNGFEGPISPTLGSLPLLQYLNLSYNNLQGNIPKEFFRPESSLITCVLSYNKLEGLILPEISNLGQLTKLYLSSNQLTGEIPSTLGNCKALQIIEMDHNYLSGNISTTLSDLKSLTQLNLAHNNLSGFIPIQLSDLQNLTELDFSYNDLQGDVPKDGVFSKAKSVSLLGNQGLCGGVQDLHLPPCPTMATRRKETQYYLIRVLIPLFGFMSLVLLVYFVLTERRLSRSKYLPFPFFEEKLLKVSYSDLAQATQNFSESNLVGRGGYGAVYRGKLLKGKQEVAVKVLDLDMHGAEKSFLSECEALRNIQHRNLVPIITACSTVDSEGKVFKALIYEFMPNGNLDMWLHHKGDDETPRRLGLTQRINIIVNIADALDYLHNDTGSRSIIHCDVKPSNILLDDDMDAHLGDFGIASFYRGSSPIGDPNTSSVGVKGTIGYIAPEYAGGGRASTCGDVYSFGIVVLEMLTGKRPTDPMFENGLNIVSFIDGNFPDQIFQVIDTALQEECSPSSNTLTEREVYQCCCSLVDVALRCTRQYPSERMDMRQAAAKVREIQSSYVRKKNETAPSL